MRDPIQRVALISAALIGIGVLLAGVLPDLLLEGAPHLAVLHAGVGVVAATTGYFFVARMVHAREHMRASTAALLTDLQSHERLLAENLQQRALLEAILEADPDGIAVLAGGELRYQLVNSAHRSFTPYPSLDPVACAYADVWRDAGCVELAATLRQVAAGGEPADLQCGECRYPDGRVSYFDMHVRRLEWEQGQAVLIVLQDITGAEMARRQAQAATLEAQRRADELDVVFEAMLEGVIVFDANGTPIRANPFAARFVGHSLGSPDRSEMVRSMKLRRPGQALIEPNDLPSGRALRGEKVSGDRFIIVDPEGREFTIMASAAPLLVGDGITGAVAVWRDVTELERTEDQMREALAASRRREAEIAALLAQLETSEERWRSLVESSNDAMVTLNTAGVIVFCNRAAQRTFGYDEEELIGRAFISLLAPGEAAGQEGETWEQRYAAASALSGRSLDATGRRRNGTDFPLEFSYAPWQTREGAFITAGIRDITQRVQARERAQRLAAVEERQRLARELHDSVSQALYGIALGANTALTMLDSSRERTVAALDYVISLADVGLTEMRALIFQLRPDALQTEGLVAGLAKHAAALRARYGTAVQEEFCVEPDVALELKESVYRIAQEALNNAVKHAQATQIGLRLDARATASSWKSAITARASMLPVPSPAIWACARCASGRSNTGAYLRSTACPAGAPVCARLSLFTRASSSASPYLRTCSAQRRLTSNLNTVFAMDSKTCYN